MTSKKKSAIISCKTHLGGEISWHRHQEIVHQEAEKIQEKVHQEIQKEQALELGVEKNLLLLREKMLIVQ